MSGFAIDDSRLPVPDSPQTYAAFVRFLVDGEQAEGVERRQYAERLNRLLNHAPWSAAFSEAWSRNWLPLGVQSEWARRRFEFLVTTFGAGVIDPDIGLAEFFTLLIDADDKRRCDEVGGRVDRLIALLHGICRWVEEVAREIRETHSDPPKTPWGRSEAERRAKAREARAKKEAAHRLLPLTRAQGVERYVARCKAAGVSPMDPDVMEEMRRCGEHFLSADRSRHLMTLEEMMDALDRHDAENPAGRVDCQQGLEAPPEPPCAETGSDPLAEAEGALKSSPRGAELVRYLASQCHGSASLDRIAIDIDKSCRYVTNQLRATVRQRFERTRRTLRDAGTRLQLRIVNNTVEIVDTAVPGVLRDPTSERSEGA